MSVCENQEPTKQEPAKQPPPSTEESPGLIERYIGIVEQVTIRTGEDESIPTMLPQ